MPKQSDRKQGDNLPRMARTKSKTGCKTCKIRRVRCGEERPACRRCVSTGRVCDGYGIWGGGGNTYEQRHAARQAATKAALVTRASANAAYFHPLPEGATANLDPDEYYHFTWFWRRSARKMSGAFFSETTTALIFQVCHSDPAVTHAILSLCSAHRSSDKAGSAQQSTSVRPEEGFALRQYNKAITHLQQHLQMDDLTSLRIALCSCLVFIWVEYFRSRYKSAANHLRHGLRMLQHAQGVSGSTKLGGSLFDGWMVGVYKKLYVQTTLFGQRPGQAWPFPNDRQAVSTISTFSDAHEARDYLENLFLELCQLLESSTLSRSTESARLQPSKAVAGKIEDALDSWQLACANTRAFLESRGEVVEAFACRVLAIYHLMAKIMANTACETEECKYDRHTASFLSIIHQVLDMRKIANNLDIRQQFFGIEKGMAHSIGDMGPLAPLYFLAVKCRVRRLRVHAIKLLEEEPRKEGMYDATLAANIARRVLAVEDAAIDENSTSGEDAFSLTDYPKASNLPTPQLSECRRVRILKVLLPEAPWNPAILVCKRQKILRQYRISQRPPTGQSGDGEPFVTLKGGLSDTGQESCNNGG